MNGFDFDGSVVAVIVVLVSLGRLVKVAFATLRICVEEYYAFRRWLTDLQRTSGYHDDS